MTTVRIVLNSPLISKDETRILAQMTRQVLADYLPQWSLPQVKVEVSTVIGAPGTQHVYLTEQNVNPQAFGHHGQENGVPAAWVSPYICGLVAGQLKPLHDAILWGNIRPALPQVVDDTGKVTFPGAPAAYTKGLAGVVIEEILEMMIDPTIDRFAKDATGTEVLVEVNDHAYRGEYVIDVVTRLSLFRKPTHTLVVLPDSTLPSFYKVDGKAPFTTAQLLLKAKKIVNATGVLIDHPFDFRSGSYAYRKVNGAGVMTFFARKTEPDEILPVTN